MTDRRVERQVTEAGRVVRRTSYRELIENLIMRSYSPPGVLINEKNEVVYIHGRTGKYLEPAAGEANWNILAMAREGLRMELATSIRKAGTERQQIRNNRLLIKTNGESQLINLVVIPIEEPQEMKGLLTVLFEEIPSEPKAGEAGSGDDLMPTPVHPEVRQLEKELRSTKEYLQTTIEELETSNEELKSTNEELQSSNEELQSTNEELETSKEELQSVNEELSTVNTELQQKIEELSKTSSDLSNLLASTQIGTIFLDTNLNIQRFTPAVTNFINLIQSDVGRPLAHIVSNLRYENLVADAGDVLRTLVLKELEVQTKDDRWYTMRILPYRTVENVIDGVVVTFFDITRLREAEGRVVTARLKAERSELDFRQIVDVVKHVIVYVDMAGRITFLNAFAQEFFGRKEMEIIGRPFATTLAPKEDLADPSQENLIATIAESPDRPVQREYVNLRKNGEEVRMLWSYTAIFGDDGSVVGVMGLAQEVTGSPRVCES